MRSSVLATVLALVLGHAARAEEKAEPPVSSQAGLPNVLIVEIGGFGPGLPDTFGGEVRTPTLSRVAASGTVYADSDNLVSPPAKIAAALKKRGYDTAAFGRWIGIPVGETGPAGPLDRWPTRQGVGSFYGFLGREASQYHPGLVRDTELVQPPKTPAQGYYLTTDLADEAIAWLQRHRRAAPERPFFVYWAPGAGHGPQQVPRSWADAYRGRFDDGWDAYHDRVFERAQQAGWLPTSARPAPRPPRLPAWKAVPEAEKPFQRRLMEVFAGYLGHADASAGRVLDEIERLGYRDDTLVIYRWGDGTLSAEGGEGVISGMLARNGIASRPAHHIGALERMGGLGLLGGPKAENTVHAGWEWAAQFNRLENAEEARDPGLRLPVAVFWPERIRRDISPRRALRPARDAGALEEPLGIAGSGNDDSWDPDWDRDPNPLARPPEVQRKIDWRFAGADRRIPEAIAPQVGTLGNTVTIEAKLAANASGVLYALGGIGGGVTVYLDAGTLVYEYNIFEIQRVKIRAKEKLPAGKHVIEIETELSSEKPRAPARITLSVDGRPLATGVVAITAPVAFSRFETFDVGADLGSPVSLDYFDRAPFALQGSIERLEVRVRPRSP